MRGMGRVFKRGNVWWIAYSRNGKEYRESSGSSKESNANRLLKKRLGEIGLGKFIGPAEEKLTFEDMAQDFLTDYKLKGNRTVSWAEQRVNHLRGFFLHDKAIDITTDRIRAFQQYRLEQGASNGTVNRSMAVLSRMFSLAIQVGKLSRKPHIPKLKEAEPRQGFLEHWEFEAIRENLSLSVYQHILDFGYYSGWRRGEILTLEWRDMDLDGNVIRLRPERSKNKEGRILPLSPPLREVIEARLRDRTLESPLAGC